MVELLTSWLTQLKNGDHVGVTMQINDAVKAVSIDNATYKTAAATLAQAIEGEDLAYRKTQKDWAVEDLKTVDTRLDAYMKGMRSILAGHAGMPDGETLKQHALEFLQLWKDYDFKICNSYSSESAKVINMYQDAAARKADAEALGVWGYFEKAKKEADKMQQLLSERFDELASRTAGEMKAARAATDEAVKAMYLVITSLQVLTPSEKLTELAKKLRAIEDYARIYYLRIPASTGDDTSGGITGPDSGSGPGNGESGTPPMGGD